MRLLLAFLAFLLCACDARQVPPVVEAPPQTKAEATVSADLAKAKAQVASLTSALGARAETLAEQDVRIKEAEEQVQAADATAAAARKVLENERRDRVAMEREQRRARIARVLEWCSGLFALGALAAGVAWWFTPLAKGTFAGVAIACAGLAVASLFLASYVQLLPWLGLAALLGAAVALWREWHNHAKALVDLAQHPGAAHMIDTLEDRTRALVERLQEKAKA